MKEYHQLKLGEIIKKEIPNIPITVSLRVRDKTEKEIIKFVDTCVSIGFTGILILMGDPVTIRSTRFRSSFKFSS